MTTAEAIEQLKVTAQHPDIDCVAYVDEVVPVLLEVAAAALLVGEIVTSDVVSADLVPPDVIYAAYSGLMAALKKLADVAGPLS